MNILRPFPFAIRAICNDAHSNRPISSKIREIKMIAIKDKVAFHVIPITVPTSEKSTMPSNNAITAPAIADQPIFNPRGCQITKSKVMINKRLANKNMNCHHNDTYCLLQVYQ